MFNKVVALIQELQQDCGERLSISNLKRNRVEMLVDVRELCQQRREELKYTVAICAKDAQDQICITFLERIRSQEPEKRSEEHTSELQSLMRISYAVFCLKKQKKKPTTHITTKKHNT